MSLFRAILYVVFSFIAGLGGVEKWKADDNIVNRSGRIKFQNSKCYVDF